MTLSDRHTSVFDSTRVDSEVLHTLNRSEHHSPHDVLGAHPIKVDREEGVVVRSFHPDAETCDLLLGDEVLPMQPQGMGLFSVYLPQVRVPISYRLRFGFADGSSWEREDPYRFAPSIGETDLYLFLLRRMSPHLIIKVRGHYEQTIPWTCSNHSLFRFGCLRQRRRARQRIRRPQPPGQPRRG